MSTAYTGVIKTCTTAFADTAIETCAAAGTNIITVTGAAAFVRTWVLATGFTAAFTNSLHASIAMRTSIAFAATAVIITFVTILACCRIITANYYAAKAVIVTSLTDST